MGIAEQACSRERVRVLDFACSKVMAGGHLRGASWLLLSLPYLIGNRPGLGGSPSSSVRTIVHELPSSSGRSAPSPATATEFSVGGKIMWRKPEDSKPAGSAGEGPTPSQSSKVEPTVRSVAGLTAEVVQPSGGTITSTLTIKGEVRGNEDLYIDGEVQGTIHLTNGRVTIGPHGKISADVDAREIVVRGKVKGALRGRERVEIGSTAEVRG